MIDKMNILTEENLQEIREYIVETTKRDIDANIGEYTIVDICGIREILNEFIYDTTEDILQEIKPHLEKKIKREVLKMLEG